MKIILKGLNGAFVNFDNVFKIDVIKPYKEENPWKVMAYSGREAIRYDNGECILFQGTEEEVKNWEGLFEETITEVRPNQGLAIIYCSNL